MTLHRSLALSSLMALAALLAACGRSGDDASVGQRVDAAMERASEAARRMGSNARDAARQAASSTSDRAHPAASQASASASGGSGSSSSASSSSGSGAGAQMSDTRITATVKMGLTADKDLSAGSIDVDTQAGVVTLKGSAPSATAKARAGEIARNVRDVKSVDNQLVVPGG